MHTDTSPDSLTRPMESVYFKKGKGQPVIMLHSSMSTKEQWGKLAASMCDDYLAIAIDLSGYGAAEFPRSGPLFSLEEEAARIDSLVTHLVGQQKIHLIGHSYGGATALRLAYANQQRILSLSLYEPVAFHLLGADDPEREKVIALAHKVESFSNRQEYSKATQVFVDFWSGEGTYLKLNKARRALLDPFIPKVTLDFQAGITDQLTVTDYQKLDVPACLVAGRQSPLPTQIISTILARTLPRNEFHWIDGGHMAPLSHASIVNPIWADFIRSITAAN